MDAVTRLLVGARVSKLERPLVEDRRAPAGEPHRRLEAGRPGGAHGVPVPGRHHVALREREHAARPREPQRGRQLAGGHAQHERARDGGVERRVVREGVREEAEGRAQYPSANFASSLISSGVQGGVKVIVD